MPTVNLGNIVGPPGPKGETGPYHFEVNEAGELILYSAGDTAPNYRIDENGHLLIEDQTTIDLGKVVGDSGKSAYQYAQDGGYTGTEEEFATKLSEEYPTFSNLRAATPVNLLDNSYFSNPVAQAGIKGYHGNQLYALDRWKLVSGDVAFDTNAKALTLFGKLTQTLEHPPETEVSLFAEYVGSPLSMSYEDGVVTIESSDNCLIKWVAMYEGVYTEQTRPEYRPKGYAAELAECKRYFQIVEQGTIRTTPTQDSCQLFANAVSPMRIMNPTAILVNGGLVLTGAGNPAIASVENAYATSNTKDWGCHYLMGATVPGIPVQNWFNGYAWVTGKINLSADL